MPFGLTNAPAVFQAMINDVLLDFLYKFVYVYLDDIWIYSPDLVSHRLHVSQVLQRLLDNHLYVKAEKGEFHVNTVSFLGFIVAPRRVEMDPAKVSAVAKWPTPDSRKKVQQFLGFANFYRRFIWGFSSVAAPLHALTSPRVRFVWSPSTSSSATSPQHPFSLFQIPSDHSWWRWMHPTTEWGQCCHGSVMTRCVSSFPVLFWNIDCPSRFRYLALPLVSLVWSVSTCSPWSLMCSNSLRLPLSCASVS